MKLHSYPIAVAAVLVGALGACGGSTSNEGGNPPPPPPPAEDAGTPVDTTDAAPPPPPVDHGAPSDTYPAFKPDVPQLRKNQGVVLKNPKIVTVTWPTDENADGLEAFGDTIGTTKYWAAVTAEYGVGPAVSGAANHVRMTTPLKDKARDEDLDVLVDVNTSGKSAGGFDPDATKWPAFDDNTVYILYPPASAHFQVQDDTGAEVDACNSSIGGYHTVSQSGGIVYAVVPECAGDTGSPFDTSTESASHELAEAAVDPQPGSGWAGLDADHAIWTVANAFQRENGDLCEFYQDSFYKETETSFLYQVQRQWSNKDFAAGHAPCSPAAPGAYFSTTPLDLEPITITNFGQKKTTKGIKVAVGETKSFSIGFYSDGPTDAWDITLQESSPVMKALGLPLTNNLSFTADKTSGKNGEKAVISVTMNKAPATGQNDAPTFLMITSKTAAAGKIGGRPVYVAVSTQ